MVKNLRKFRQARGISQQQLADVIGASQQSINKYENHSVEPDISALMKLADYFGISIDQLVGYVPGGDTSAAEEPALSREEVNLLQQYRRLTKEEKESIQLILKNYCKAKIKPETNVQ